ncbi:UBC-like protein [Bimuria novae-zelandiae CBS 107.79]|uniref:UBC-like protein n=1 Tax=Bimuria novae-zelandiae CBS 107.79 TaxID=1447943 RepID=A0A6A5UQS2_9PLEO|nr:UBC-like protein [Bimuria novae-zelandiae CBS 107.79]
MASRGFNTKTPTIKRILKEAKELESNPSRDFYAAPQEDNLFEWHFTLRGPPAPSPYANGIYHGRIILPATYPLKPPNFRFLTPTGRFEVNREICLSISGHHEETWQPAWGIRTALVAIRSFMDSEAKGQVGGLDCDRSARERMAGESGAWRCAACGKSNREILREREEACAEEGEGKEEVVPEELRLQYREDLGRRAEQPDENATPAAETATENGAPVAAPAAGPVAASSSAPAQQTSRTQPPPAPQPTRTAPAAAPALPARQAPAPQQPPPDRSLQWIDACIYGIATALIFMLLKKFAA